MNQETGASVDRRGHGLEREVARASRVAVFGVGAMGRQALRYLHEAGVGTLLACDPAHTAEEALAQSGGGRVQFLREGVESVAQARGILRELEPSIVVSMVPPALAPILAAACIAEGVSFVSTNFPHADILGLDAEARARGVVVVTGMGFDPGIDLLMLREAAECFDSVDSVRSFGSGVPERPGSNPLNYAVTWSFAGFLAACVRSARQVHHGRVVDVPGDQLFEPTHTFLVTTLDGHTMEAYPNGDATEFRRVPQVAEATHLGAYTLRWPGHAAFFSELVKLGLLDDREALVDAPEMLSSYEILARWAKRHPQVGDPIWEALATGCAVGMEASEDHPAQHPRAEFWRKMTLLGFLRSDVSETRQPGLTMRAFVAGQLAPILRLGDDERDMALIRLEVRGRVGGREATRVMELVEKRDLHDDCLAMAQGVSRTAVQTALHVLLGSVPPGVHDALSLPAHVSAAVLADLETAGMQIHRAWL